MKRFLYILSLLVASSLILIIIVVIVKNRISNDFNVNNYYNDNRQIMGNIANKLIALNEEYVFIYASKNNIHVNNGENGSIEINDDLLQDLKQYFNIAKGYPQPTIRCRIIEPESSLEVEFAFFNKNKNIDFGVAYTRNPKYMHYEAVGDNWYLYSIGMP